MVAKRKNKKAHLSHCGTGELQESKPTFDFYV